MPNPTYERVSDNDTDEDCVDIPSQPARVQPRPDLVVRPPVYYGDGPFDPPSSEEEDEDRFLDKSERHHALNPGEFRDSEPGNGLRVGGGKVSTLPQRNTLKFIPVSHLAAGCPETSYILPGSVGVLVGLHWCVCRNQSLSWKAVPCIKRAKDIARPHIQWNL